MPTFVVERYLPGVSRAAAGAMIERERELVDAMVREGHTICVLHATLVEGDETVMSVVEAQSRADVLELGERSGAPADRVVPAVEMAASRHTRRKEAIP